MLSYPGCQVRAVHWLHSNLRASSSSDIIVMLKWRHHVMSHFSVSGIFSETSGTLTAVFKGDKETKSIIQVSLVMPNYDPRDRFFYPTLTLMNFLYCIVIFFYRWWSGKHIVFWDRWWRVNGGRTWRTRFVPLAPHAGIQMGGSGGGIIKLWLAPVLFINVSCHILVASLTLMALF